MAKKITKDQQRFAFEDLTDSKGYKFSHRVTRVSTEATLEEQKQTELLQDILLQLKLLNARYEETAETFITEKDVDNGTNLG